MTYVRKEMNMDNTIRDKITASLEESLDGMSKELSRRDELEAQIRSGRYSGDTIRREKQPQLTAIRGEIARKTEEAFRKAEEMIACYKADIEKRGVLDPAELNDDLKLLQPGISLLPRDLYAILERNKNNRTMTQIILRYAKEHDIKIEGFGNIDDQADRNNAAALESSLRYYRKWFDTPKLKELLHKFFAI